MCSIFPGEREDNLVCSGPQVKEDNLSQKVLM